MANHKEHVHTSPLQLFKCKCPRCRQGNMFQEKNPYKLRSFMKMNDQCPVCGQYFDLEVGFYYGSSYVSYALTVAFSGFTFAAWWFTIGFSLTDSRIFYWMAVNAVLLILLQPVFMRVARTLWLAFFIRYDKNWSDHAINKPERQNEAWKNAW
ncbi:DUF983 domain-containing protein [Danxiaibacter flavus]|uniref:DUF983 domain-containing protein n=1 Tax=Danxiaibacter flavus TaxID=3049108 RepID=A0ABV3ZGK8_9BACT|nr:DUF983 domain-containing protein [Chitinophagaceae bacterium DXS]